MPGAAPYCAAVCATFVRPSGKPGLNFQRVAGSSQPSSKRKLSSLTPRCFVSSSPKLWTTVDRAAARCSGRSIPGRTRSCNAERCDRDARVRVPRSSESRGAIGRDASRRSRKNRSRFDRPATEVRETSQQEARSARTRHSDSGCSKPRNQVPAVIGDPFTLPRDGGAGHDSRR